MILHYYRNCFPVYFGLAVNGFDLEFSFISNFNHFVKYSRLFDILLILLFFDFIKFQFTNEILIVCGLIEYIVFKNFIFLTKLQKAFYQVLPFISSFN